MASTRIVISITLSKPTEPETMPNKYANKTGWNVGKAALNTTEELLVLINNYSLTNLQYVDISEQEQIGKIMEHWPLLAELSGIN